MQNKIYKQLKENILKKLEEAEKNPDGFRWIKPWQANCPLPKPYFSKLNSYYSGVNLLLLEPSEYLTFNMIKKLQENDDSIKLRKGSKAETIYYYSFTTKKDKETGLPELDENGNEITVPFMKFYKVFSIDDVDNLDSRIPYKKNEHTLTDKMKKAELYIKKYCEMNDIDMAVKKGGQSAYYNPATNQITVPDLSQYKMAEKYFSTAFHELTHSIDHKLKLIAVEDKTEKDNRYSSGELLAEIGANFLLNYFQIADEKGNCEHNNISYIKGWYSTIKDAPDYFVPQIANKATKAVMHFINSVEMELMKEQITDLDKIVVCNVAGNKYIEIQVNSEDDFDYSIYDYKEGQLELLDGGVLENGDEISNLYDALEDILNDLDIAEDDIKPVDVEEFEQMTIRNETLEER